MTQLNRRQIPTAIANGNDFYGSHVHGAPVNPDSAPYVNTGRLDDYWVQIIREDPPTYLVYSYGTPIAWRSRDGHVIVPDESYSVTTSAHQSLAAEGFTGNRAYRTKR